MYNWFTLLESRNEHSIISQLYFKIFFLENLKMELMCDSAILLLGLYSEKIMVPKMHALQYSLQHYLH